MDPDAEAAQRVGTTLCNKWTLERLLGTGGMAAVYVATHKIGRREAIKILHADVARDPDLRARFEQEAHAVNRFKHPGAVEVRDIDVAEDGSPFLVMELLEGESLAALARRDGGVEMSSLLRWVDEILDVLAAAHAQGIIHRDIKPDNLFVQSDGRLKVLDFGIARVRAGVSSRPRTRVGATLGTAPYMPPEQIRGVEIDARADLFAVGATMFRLIAKQRIHEAPSEAEMLVKMSSLPAPPLASVAPGAPPSVALVVDRALMFDREHRYPDALTMQHDVRAVRGGGPPPYATAHLADLPPSPHPGAVASSRSAPPATPDASTPLLENTAPATHVGGPSTRPASPGALKAGSEPPRAFVAASVAMPRAPATPLLGSIGVPAAAETPAPLAVHAPADQSPPRGAVAVDGSTPRPSAAQGATPAGPGPVSSSLELSLPQTSSPPVAGERTLRSQAGPEADGAVVEPQGYAVASAVSVVKRATSPGPRTQQSGVAPMPAAPGESVPVLPAPPLPPRRRRTLPGTEISVWPLVIVGLVFATIGVAVTLWLMLGSERSSNETPAVPSSTAQPSEPAETIINGHPTAHAPQHPTPALTHGGGLAPQHNPAKPTHGH
jgi:serine/threonine-protein kinase